MAIGAPIRSRVPADGHRRTEVGPCGLQGTHDHERPADTLILEICLVHDPLQRVYDHITHRAWPRPFY